MRHPLFRIRKACWQNQLQYSHEQCMRLMLHMLFRILFFVFWTSAEGRNQPRMSLYKKVNSNSLFLREVPIFF